MTRLEQHFALADRDEDGGYGPWVDVEVCDGWEPMHQEVGNPRARRAPRGFDIEMSLQPTVEPPDYSKPVARLPYTMAPVKDLPEHVPPMIPGEPVYGWRVDRHGYIYARVVMPA